MKTKFYKHRKPIKSISTILLFLIAFFANAQLKGGHILGGVGLQSGTQAPENTLAVYVPGYFYSASTLRDSNGDIAVRNPDINAVVTGVGISWVSNFKILGAGYGATALFALASNKIEGNNVNIDGSLAFTDTYLIPVQLGWHEKKADFMFSYALYLPTGKYKAGASDNSGLGMYINEFSAGTTLFFNDKKTFHFATTVSYEINSKKKDTEIKTGNIVSLEGGLGKTFYCMNAEKTSPQSIINAGLIYYLQYKVTDDEIPVGNTIWVGDKDRVAALGAEINFLHLKSNSTIGLRWLGEIDAVNRFQGNTFFLTLAHIFSMKKE